MNCIGYKIVFCYGMSGHRGSREENKKKKVTVKYDAFLQSTFKILAEILDTLRTLALNTVVAWAFFEWIPNGIVELSDKPSENK